MREVVPDYKCSAAGCYRTIKDMSIVVFDQRFCMKCAHNNGATKAYVAALMAPTHV